MTFEQYNTLDLSHLKRRMEPSVRTYGVFQALRARFRETYDTGLLRFPVTAHDSARLDDAIRLALHMFGNPREDSASAEGFAAAVLHIEREITAIRWINENPHFATDVAAHAIKRREVRP